MPTGVQLAGKTKNSFVQHFPYETQAEAEFFK